MSLSHILKVIGAAALLNNLAGAYSDKAADPDARKYQFEKTLYVIEVMEHGTRAHYEDNVDTTEFFGVNKGHLTKRGRSEAYKIGMKRRDEYLDKRIVTWKYNANVILSLSTFAP